MTMNTAPKLQHIEKLKAVRSMTPYGSPECAALDYAIAALAPPSGEPRGLDTPRRMSAVEVLIKLGYKWDGRQWLAPPNGEGVGKVVAWMKPDGSDVILARDRVERWVNIYTIPLTTPQSASVDGEFVLVPREPTPQMIDATWDHTIDRDGGIESQNTRNHRIYTAMIAAAPTTPPASQERGGDSIVLDAYQLRCAAEFAAPDYEQDEDQRGTELIFQSLPERIIDGETLPSGMYCWYADYPEEGVMHLEEYEEYEARMTKVASPPNSAADKMVEYPPLDWDAAEQAKPDGYKPLSGGCIGKKPMCDQCAAGNYSLCRYEQAQAGELRDSLSRLLAGGVTVDDAMVERAMQASIPGGSQAWVWLFNCEGGMAPEEKHRDWFRRVLTAALGAK